jgi:Polyketide cyclase / dehydrase and lipid transport
MSHWTATTTTNATPDRLLAVLTHPDEIKRWSPVEFDLDDLEDPRLQAGTRARVTGALAGVKVAFDVEVQAADEGGIELTADGPVGLDVRYDLVPADRGAELSASVSLRRRGGLTGRLVGGATAALLATGVLDGAAGRIARRAELAAAA